MPGTADDLQFRAHIDWRFVRDNLAHVRQNARDRNSPADPDVVVQLYERWRRLDEAAEELRAARNANAKAAKVWHLRRCVLDTATPDLGKGL